MAYSDNIIKGNYKEATVDELANVLITLDGLGQAKKRQALIELLHRASMDDMDVWDWTTPHEEIDQETQNKS
jgi:hypothetical protein